ncbi:MAG: PEP-CTERM sorting domain-containing protein [Acidobacteria bacterium]|nr:PEP-CTERM sorting domain-containing protein [Acidobacteriota bacterium]
MDAKLLEQRRALAYVAEKKPPERDDQMEKRLLKNIQSSATVWFVLLCAAVVMMQGNPLRADEITEACDPLTDPECDPLLTVTIDTLISGSTVNLSSIIDKWFTPGNTGTAYTIPGTGAGKDSTLNIVNDLGSTITALYVSLYGTLGGGSGKSNPANEFSWGCAGDVFTSCGWAPTAILSGDSGGQVVVSSSDPEMWTFSGGSGILNDGLFKFSGNQTGSGKDTEVFYKISADLVEPPTPIPEPTSLLLMGSGLLAIGRIWRKKKA